VKWVNIAGKGSKNEKGKTKEWGEVQKDCTGENLKKGNRVKGLKILKVNLLRL